MPKRYAVKSNHCTCHPETCCCDDWMITKDGKKYATFFLKSVAYEICANLNKLDEIERQIEKEAPCQEQTNQESGPVPPAGNS